MAACASSRLGFVTRPAFSGHPRRSGLNAPTALPCWPDTRWEAEIMTERKEFIHALIITGVSLALYCIVFLYRMEIIAR